MNVKDVLEEIEAEIILKQNIYKSYINQPNLIAISSDNASIKKENITSDSFFSFTCNLEKPAIQVKGLQLLSANIPQCKAYSFDDTELVFAYYRFKTQDNIAGHTYFTEQPNIDNLYYVRLLPSYYPSNIIPNAQLYGFNKTFNNYQELSDELAKSCSSDLLHTNILFNKFIPNDITISYNEEMNKFQMIGNNTTTAWTPPSWSDSVTYQSNQIILWEEGIYYISLIDNNFNNDPPTTTSAWTLYTGTIGYTYLIAGYEDPNVLILQENINSQAVGANADFFYGLYGLNNIMSILSQPFKQGKTLAKRLGFTWNCRGTLPSQNNSVTPLEYAQGSSFPIFWNRLRPIPKYELITAFDTIPIPNNSPFTSTTYIAEAYCNLVYSSIINIYSNLTSGASFDTQTVMRNLLGMIPINCGQLGITFQNTYIDNLMTKINSDIYTLTIELRNEIDEPYYITNNGIATFVIKLTY